MSLEILLASLEFPVEFRPLVDLVHPRSDRHGLALLFLPLREPPCLLLLPPDGRSELLSALSAREHAFHALSLVQVPLVTACGKMKADQQTRRMARSRSGVE